MTEALREIVANFESALLDGVRTGADEAGLTKIRDAAFDRLRDGTLDPHFGHENEGDAEFAAWRWPDRSMFNFGKE
ncbi:hypothetical protein JQ581_02405 [Bradyrhizobium liaoningense]|uniref:hypothetical protein n=1 Tax=Bradyrhizobium liaoningense TaxID=43992 RepID=UPI001BA957E5|nr:hypothetical protein [Bradyrhizobium liaoningense]MBR0735766.1 hypothetical protein [Bradyrhizobium liaoningense]